MSERGIRRARARDRERRERAARRLAARTALSAALITGAITIVPAGASAADTIHVKNANDDGPYSLREAVDDANYDADIDTIVFDASVGPRIELSEPLLVFSPVSIEGPGADQLTIDASEYGQGFLVYEADHDQPVTISGLTITGGQTSASGGAIFSGDYLGAGSELTVADCVINRNEAADYGGGIYVDGGSLTVTGTDIERNQSDAGGGGIFVRSTDGDENVEVTITGSTLDRNTTSATGGGARLVPRSDVLIQRSTISENTAALGGPGLFMEGEVPSIGAVIDSTTISGNTGESGSFGSGGGLYLTGLDGPVDIRSSTLSGNVGTQGGGIFLSTPVRLNVSGSTIADNTSLDYGGGINNPIGAPLKLRGSVVAGNHAYQAEDLSGPAEASHSLIGKTAGADITASPAGSNRLDVAAQLGPLADNGGPTETMLPAPTSPAIDAGLALGSTTDQRGLARTVDQPAAQFAGSDGTDIGAVELPDETLDGADVTVKKKQKQKGKKIVVKVRVGAAEAATAMASGKIGKAKLKGVTTSIAANKTAALKLKPKGKKTSKKLAKKLDKGKQLKAKLSVTITDGAGNEETAKPKVTLK